MQSTNDSTLNSEQNNVIKPKYKDYGNSLVISGTNFYVPQLRPFSFDLRPQFFPQQKSIYINRKVYKNWRLEIGYNEWNPNKDFLQLPELWGTPNFELKPGALEFRILYRMIDFMVCYKLNRLKKYNILLGIGYSKCWGANTYIDSIYLNPGPPYDGIIYAHSTIVLYDGIIAKIAYDYNIFRNRISIGTDIKFRKYFGAYIYQIDYGFHLKLNF